MNPFTIRSMSAVLLYAAAVLALPSCSDNNPPPKAETSEAQTYQSGVPGGVAVETTTMTANVVSVSKPTREVVLDLPGGQRETVKCGPHVVNFDRIRAGDRVKITLTEEIAVSMASESESESADAARVAVVALAPKGAQPGAVMADAKRVTATVTAIDVAGHTATLQFPDGQTRKIAVRPDIDLTKRKVGEKVVIRKADTMAIKVETPHEQ